MAEGNGVAVASDISELGDRIAGLTLVQAVSLKNYLKERHGIEPAAGGGVMMAAPAAATTATKEEPKTEFTVILDDYPADKKITIIKVVRELTGLGLKEAKDLVEAKGKPVKENVQKEDAEKAKKSLEDAGAKVSVK